MSKYENFFEKLENTSPYLKFAAQGSAGSGKTYTEALIAIGLHKRIGSTKPIVIFDTEKSSKFLRPLFKEAGIDVIVKQSRTLPDLVKTLQFCDENNADVAMIDSITHVYEDFIEDYKRKKNRSYIQFQDWGILKPTWKKEFSDRFVNCRCHILFTGRQGFTYDYEENDQGKRELVKTGVKMKAEGETAYEPDVLVMMERFEDVLGVEKKVWREATILKDRSTLLDGHSIINPKYSDFEPVIDFLLTDKADPVETDSIPNDYLIKDEESRSNERKECAIQLERNQALLDTVASGTSKESKAMRIALTRHAYYGETSELAIASMNLGQLEEAYSRLKERVDIIERILKGEPKVYNSAKLVTEARIANLDTDNLGDVDADTLNKYLQQLLNIFNGNAA